MPFVLEGALRIPEEDAKRGLVLTARISLVWPQGGTGQRGPPIEARAPSVRKSLKAEEASVTTQ